MKSRSIRYAQPGKVEIIEIDVPEPGPGEVLVQGLVCGICTWDLHTFKVGSNGPNPAPPGHEGVGRVVKLGPGVSTVREGARVVGYGFADYYVMPAAGLLVLPEDSKIPDEHWLVEPASCAVTGVDHCRLRVGDRVALIGCGFMGLMILQMLGRSYAEEVTAIDLDPRRLELAQRFGAKQLINTANPGAGDLLASLRSRPVDTTVDSTGAQAGINLASQITRGGGRLNLFGWNHGAATFPGDAWHLGGFTVVNSAPGSALRSVFPVAIRLIHLGFIDLKPLVTHVVPLEQFQQVLEKGVSKSDGYIKGVVRLSA